MDTGRILDLFNERSYRACYLRDIKETRTDFCHILYEVIVTCRGLCMINKTGTGLDDWIY
jgi:hypothetical protein